MRPRIYISGPITLGDAKHNFQQAAEAQRRLLIEGFAPWNPMLTMLLDYAEEIPHAVWVDADLPWIEAAKAVLRLPGESVGADAEVAFARSKDVLVYYDIDELIADKEDLQ